MRRRHFGLVAAVLLLSACESDSTSDPLEFESSVRVGGLCCLLWAPTIAVDGDNVYVGWSESIRFTSYLPLYRSTDGGASFDDSLSFDDATGGDADAFTIALSVFGRLHLVWEDSRNGICDPFCRGYDIYSTWSVDSGDAFADNRPADGGPAIGASAQGRPAQTITDAGAVLVVWEDSRFGGSEVFISRSLDRGVSFETGRPLEATGARPRSQRSPTIASEIDGRVFVAWLDDRGGSRNVYLAVSDDRGASFDPGAPLHPSDAGATDRSNVKLVATGLGTLVAVWAEHRDDVWQIYRAVSRDGGASFTIPAAVEPTQANQRLPTIATHATGDVYLGWQDERSGQGRVHVARSRDGADSFEPSVFVDDPGNLEGDQESPALTVGSGGAVFVTWVDFTKPDPGIFFARSVE